jgi:dTDP-4-dehydrorhamnose reductase
VVSGMLDQFSCGLQAWGIYHYCSSDITNCYEFAEVLLAAASQYEEFSGEAVLATAEEAGVNIVSRNLDCSKIKDTFAIKQQPWRASVAGQVKQYYTEQSSKESSDVENDRHPDAST